MEWLKISEVAKILSISEKSVRRLINTQKLRAKNMSTGRKKPQWRIHVQWLEEFKENIPIQE